MTYNGYGLGAAAESGYCVEPEKESTCECGKVYPKFSKKVHSSSINGIRNGCISCKPDRYQREIAKAATRCQLRLARHIAKARCGNRKVYRDVAVRYLQRFGGQTFSVQTEIDDAEIYLENSKGQIICKVDYRDKYPTDTQSDFSDMPF